MARQVYMYLAQFSYKIYDFVTKVNLWVKLYQNSWFYNRIAKNTTVIVAGFGVPLEAFTETLLDSICRSAREPFYPKSV